MYLMRRMDECRAEDEAVIADIPILLVLVPSAFGDIETLGYN